MAPRDDDIGLNHGLAFVAHSARPAYAPPMSFETTVEFVATASGFDELCRENLYDTVKNPQASGISDHQLEKLPVTEQQRLASS